MGRNLWQEWNAPSAAPLYFIGTVITVLGVSMGPSQSEGALMISALGVLTILAAYVLGRIL